MNLPTEELLYEIGRPNQLLKIEKRLEKMWSRPDVQKLAKDILKAKKKRTTTGVYRDELRQPFNMPSKETSSDRAESTASSTSPTSSNTVLPEISDDMLD